MTCNILYILSALLFMFPETLFSQEACLAEPDEIVFNKYVNHISPYQSQPIEKILEETATFFLGTPYVSHTLDQNEKEALVVNLREMDCVTFVENVLALSFAAQSNNLSMENFMNKLTEIRYRNNEVLDYASRIHYTSDWIFENEKKNLLKNISKDLSGVRESKKIDFMSTHRKSYNQLLNDDSMWDKIVEIENTINNRGGFYYLPKQQIVNKAIDIPHLSVVGFVTSIDGLDTSHIGFAYRENGVIKLIHASSTKNKVVIDQQSLSDYCISQKRCKGVIVAKVL